jgi:hypothetical protein
MKDQVINQNQLESVLSWIIKSHDLKFSGGTWHHQANWSATQVATQLPNVAQIC